MKHTVPLRKIRLSDLARLSTLLAHTFIVNGNARFKVVMILILGLYI